MKTTRILVLCAALGAWSLPPPAAAQNFAAVVSPPRFELDMKPGTQRREVIEITHTDPAPGTYRIRTADFTLTEDARVDISDALAPGSCRPWVAIERRELAIAAGGRYRYRFEIRAPESAPAGECRFALLIEGGDQSVKSGGLEIPVSARIAVIVYARIGDAEPALEVVQGRVGTADARPVPALVVKNNGIAHGRLAGFLSGEDATGRRFDFVPSTLPILPGESREIVLVPTAPVDRIPELRFPVSLKGRLEWGEGKFLAVDRRID
jgi:hypothetical protein